VPIRPMTGNPSQLMIEQLAASGIKYVFYNSGSREAPFFDALQENRNVHGILSLHEGIVTAVAGGYSQARGEPAVMLVHLGAGLAQCMGQLINVWYGSLPVVVLTFHGDTGSFSDRIVLDLGHNAPPQSLSVPLTKASWTVVEPEGLPAAVERAIRVAKTPPVGPVHLAIYDRLLGSKQYASHIIEGGIPDLRLGYPDDGDLEKLAIALHSAERPLIYVGDGVWKSGAEPQVTKLAERFGAAVSSATGDLRGVPISHPQHCGQFRAAASAVKPDLIVCIGARHGGIGVAADYAPFMEAKRIISLGDGVENFSNLPGLELSIMADIRRSMDRLEAMVASEHKPSRYDQRRSAALEIAAKLRENRRKGLQTERKEAGRVRPSVLLDSLQNALEKAGGGIVTTEEFAAPLEAVSAVPGGGKVAWLRPAGNSEGFGMGAPIGAKLGAPDKPVVGLVGDGSVYYHDSAFYTAVHHRVPALWVIPNNGSYGIVAGAFGEFGGTMKKSGEYSGVVLDDIDPLKIADGFGVEGHKVTEEPAVQKEIEKSLDLVEKEGRPYVLDVRLPRGLPAGGKAAKPFHLAG